MTIKKYTILIIVSLSFLTGTQNSLITEKAELMHLSGLYDDAKLLLIENIDKNVDNIETWASLMFKLGELVYKEKEFSQAREIFIQILKKDVTYLLKILEYFPSIDFRNYVKETYIVHEFAQQGTLSGSIFVTKYTNEDIQKCFFKLKQRNYNGTIYSYRETYFSPEDVRLFLSDLIMVVQTTPSMFPESADIFERNISKDSGLEFNWVGKKNKKGKLSIEIKYGNVIPDITLTNVGELQMVIKKADKMLTELGY